MSTPPQSTPPEEPPSEHGEHEAAEALSAEILALLAKLTERFDAEDNEHWQWMAAHSSTPQVVELLRDSTITAMRVLDAIGRLEPVNGIAIATQYHIPKGTVSKVTRRLITQGLVRTESLPNNRKEIWFRLTALGREAFEVHRAFDAQMERGMRQFLQRYQPNDLRLLVRVLQEAAEASFLTIGVLAESVQTRPDEARETPEAEQT